MYDRIRGGNVREDAKLLRRLRLRVPIGSLGWVVLCRATDYLDWRDGATSYYPAGPRTRTRYGARMAAWWAGRRG